ncbi:MAG: hypothetical protein NTX25_16610 [Proteobacteria bacterium]|nr:hypothetical protein [Pseudomonadota bacterium]
MKKTSDDQFLGEWAVKEYVFSSKGALIGNIQQQRRLYAIAGSDELIVSQNCQPSESLCEHPMAAFAGDFDFRLKKEGRQRLYLGPDVKGRAVSFADIFLYGVGVWPRFGYNFRSWSIRLSDTRQLTGGLFFRGVSVEAVILGLGTLVGSELPVSELNLEQSFRRAHGTRTRLDLASDLEDSQVVRRELMAPSTWRECGPTSAEDYCWQPHESAWILRQTRESAPEAEAVGMAFAYGPVLYWETHSQTGESTQALEINDPCGTQQFSIRRHFARGRLIAMDGLQFRE